MTSNEARKVGLVTVVSLGVVSGEVSADFERPSRSHFSLDSRQQAILVYNMKRALQRCVCFWNRTQIEIKRCSQIGQVTVVWAPPPPPKKKKNIDQVSELLVVFFFRVNKTISRSGEFPCVFLSLVVYILIPKTIGNRKEIVREVARGDKPYMRKSTDRKHKSVHWAEWTPSWFVLCDL